MLKMAGVRLHPGMRFVLGAVLIAAGLVRHDATPLLVIGGALVLFGVVGALTADR